MVLVLKMQLTHFLLNCANVLILFLSLGYLSLVLSFVNRTASKTTKCKQNWTDK